VTAVTSLLDDLQRRGFELIPEPPNIRVRHASRAELERNRPLLDELKRRKAEALEILATDRRWDEEWERARLESAYRWADEEAARTPSWSDAWSWCRADRPDLVEAVDAALDAIDDAFRAENVVGNIEACRALRNAVHAAATAYLAHLGRLTETDSRREK